MLSLNFINHNNKTKHKIVSVVIVFHRGSGFAIYKFLYKTLPNHLPITEDKKSKVGNKVKEQQRKNKMYNLRYLHQYFF